MRSWDPTLSCCDNSETTDVASLSRLSDHGYLLALEDINSINQLVAGSNAANCARALGAHGAPRAQTALLGHLDLLQFGFLVY